ncbi:MAG: hypothetical protein JXR12_05970 [Neptunomonas phycophila]|uniref:hypothetical protein n=1 Tax=Neptunomonas phycophila TaxID=1572645 RepID=UPI003B8DEF44
MANATAILDSTIRNFKIMVVMLYVTVAVLLFSLVDEHLTKQKLQRTLDEKRILHKVEREEWQKHIDHLKNINDVQQAAIEELELIIKEDAAAQVLEKEKLNELELTKLLLKRLSESKMTVPNAVITGKTDY